LLLTPSVPAKGYIYIRAEYPLAIQRLRKAISDLKENNLLGKNIMGTDFSFDITIKEGAGAFVCGEETSLSIPSKANVACPAPVLLSLPNQDCLASRQ